MPHLGRTRPCADCPWLRTSRPGWLGADEPVTFYRGSITNEGLYPCHSAIDYEDPEWKQTQLPNAPLCAGELIFFRNHLKGPRNAELAAAVRKVSPSPQVFSWPEEFMLHHMPGADALTAIDAAKQAQWPYGEENE